MCPLHSRSSGYRYCGLELGLWADVETSPSGNRFKDCMAAVSSIYNMAETAATKLLEMSKLSPNAGIVASKHELQMKLNFETTSGGFSVEHEAFRGRNPLLCGALATDALTEMGHAL
jgi:hypothetical protein